MYKNKKSEMQMLDLIFCMIFAVFCKRDFFCLFFSDCAIIVRETLKMQCSKETLDKFYLEFFSGNLE